MESSKKFHALCRDLEIQNIIYHVDLNIVSYQCLTTNNAKYQPSSAHAKSAK